MEGGASDDDPHSGYVPSRHQELDAVMRELRDRGPYVDNRRIRGRMHECGLGSTCTEITISFVLTDSPGE